MIKVIVQKIAEKMPSLAGKGKGVCRLEITGVVTMDLDLLNGKFSTDQSDLVEPLATLTCTEENFLNMAAGKLDPTKAFMTQKLKIKGDMTMGKKFSSLNLEQRFFLAMRLQHIFKQLSEEMASAAAPPKASNGEYGYGNLDKVLGKIEEALKSHAGKHSGVVVLDFGEPAVQMDLSVRFLITLTLFFAVFFKVEFSYTILLNRTLMGYKNMDV